MRNILRSIVDIVLSVFFATLNGWLAVNLYAYNFSDVAFDEREAGGRFELFIYMLILWPVLFLVSIFALWFLWPSQRGKRYMVFQMLVFALVMVPFAFIAYIIF